jgi:hypothetical protein
VSPAAAGRFAATVTARLPADARVPRTALLPNGRPAPAVTRRLTLPPDLRPADGRPVGDRVWAVPADEPVRLAAVAAPPPTPHPAPVPAADPAPGEPPADPPTIGRWAAAAAWAVGLAVLAIVVVRGPPGLWPEYLLAFGLLAAAAGGAAFLLAAAGGAAARVRRAWA